MTKSEYDPELLKSAFLALFKASNHFRLFYDGETEPVPADSDGLTKKDRMYRLYRLNDARECFYRADSKIKAIPGFMNDIWLREARLLLSRVVREFPTLSLPDYPGFKDYAKPAAFAKLVKQVDEFSLRRFAEIHETREKIEILWRDKTGFEVIGYTKAEIVKRMENEIPGMDAHTAGMRVSRDSRRHLRKNAPDTYEPNSVEKFMQIQKPKQKRSKPYQL